MKNIFRPLVLGLCLTSFPAFAQKETAFKKEAYIAANKEALFNKYLETPYNETLSAEDRIAGLSLLWSEAKFNFANFDLHKVNLDSLYRAYIPKVMAQQGTPEYYKELQGFYAHLHDGHTGVGVPMELLDRTMAMPGIVTEWVDGKIILTQVVPGVVLPKPVAIGDEVVQVDNVPVKEYIQQHVAPYTSFSTPQDSIARILRFELFRGDIAKEVQVTFRDKKGKTYTSNLKRLSPQGFFKSNLKVADYKVLDKNIGYLSLNTFNDEQVLEFFNTRFDEISKTNGLIIDLRNNGGGNGNLGFEILGQLVSKPFMQATTMYRTYKPTGRAWGEPIELEEAAYDWKPYKGRVYNKPVIVLTGPSTYSAAEDFTVAFRQAGRGLVIGEATGGSTGQPYFFKVPGGGFAWVCTKRDIFNDGTDFVGKGIKPDVEVKRSLSELRKGKDNVVEYAHKLVLDGMKFN